jgi:ABC-type cobalt transport system substrate-binding protein
VWRFAAIIALLVFLPLALLYLSHVLGDDDREGGDSEVTPTYEPWIPVEDYDFDALAEG